MEIRPFFDCREEILNQLLGSLEQAQDQGRYGEAEEVEQLLSRLNFMNEEMNELQRRMLQLSADTEEQVRRRLSTL